MKRIGNIIWGIVFIILGIIIGLNVLKITSINIFFNGWWTLFIIVPCFIGLFKEREKTGNVIGLLIGVALLLCCQDYVSFDIMWKLSIPIILIIIGISFVFKDLVGSKINNEIKKLNKNKKDSNEYAAVFSEQKVSFNGEEFKGSDLSAVFGGIDYDVRKANIVSDQVINASAIFGGIDIFIPTGINIKIKSTCIFGGVTDKNQHPIDEGVPTIYINATCIFGGIEIK